MNKERKPAATIEDKLAKVAPDKMNKNQVILELDSKEYKKLVKDGKISISS